MYKFFTAAIGVVLSFIATERCFAETALPESVSKIELRSLGVHIEFLPDGRSVETYQISQSARVDDKTRPIDLVRIQGKSERQNSVINFAYYTSKDGKTTDALIDNNLADAEHLNRSDKIIKFTGAASGDLETYSYSIYSSTGLIAGELMWGIDLPERISTDDVSITVTMPKSHDLHYKSTGFSFKFIKLENQNEYRWQLNGGNMPPQSTENKFTRATPTISVSTFADYPELSLAYAKILSVKDYSSEVVADKAREIIANLSDQSEIVAALYEWTKSNITYQERDIQESGITPVAPEEVIRNRRGDCKDQAFLLAVMMKVVGVEGRLAVLNSRDKYELSEPASMRNLNHMIVFVPSIGVYIDPASRAKLFDPLPWQEIGKPVLIVSLDHPELRKTPILRWQENRMLETTVMSLTSSGKFVGVTISRAEGLARVSLIRAINGIQRSGTQISADRIMKSMGERGQGGLWIYASQSDQENDVASGHFSVEPGANNVTNDLIRLPSGLPVLQEPGTLMTSAMDRIDRNRLNSTPCFSGEQVSTSTLYLPESMKVAALPNDRLVETSYFSYMVNWRRVNGGVLSDRKFIFHVAEPLCNEDMRASTDLLRKEMKFTRTEGINVRQVGAAP